MQPTGQISKPTKPFPPRFPSRSLICDFGFAVSLALSPCRVYRFSRVPTVMITSLVFLNTVFSLCSQALAVKISITSAQSLPSSMSERDGENSLSIYIFRQTAALWSDTSQDQPTPHQRRVRGGAIPRGPPLLLAIATSMATPPRYHALVQSAIDYVIELAESRRQNPIARSVFFSAITRFNILFLRVSNRGSSFLP
ncbi:unnamed protein product [Acanthosepion pharaonis]|uniref:Uncharacterized protein n=1 Tax=Acanthosepion pharaonis TaxID=158019 RepID=A0A812CA84_ACAPH|nr:unnamed protein product [Sepia pharaonis]